MKLTIEINTTDAELYSFLEAHTLADPMPIDIGDVECIGILTNTFKTKGVIRAELVVIEAD